MKISKDSWHYKLLTKDFWFVDENDGQNWVSAEYKPAMLVMED